LFIFISLALLISSDIKVPLVDLLTIMFLLSKISYAFFTVLGLILKVQASSRILGICSLTAKIFRLTKRSTSYTICSYIGVLFPKSILIFIISITIYLVKLFYDTLIF